MKKKLIISAVVALLIMPMVFATPALATVGTLLTVDAPETSVAGEAVILTITEHNDGTQGWYNPAFIVIKIDDGITETYETYGYADIVPSLSVDDVVVGRLEPGEYWTWVVTYYPVSTTTYTITGHGWLYGVEANDVTYPDYPEEQKIVTVEIEEEDGEGLTPGFWKNHIDEWSNTDYSPDDNFYDTFGVGPSITLIEAVNLGDGGENAFLRHAVAALLNATHPDIDYGMSIGEVINAIMAAYGPGGDFEATKDIFEGYNETEFELYD